MSTHFDIPEWWDASGNHHQDYPSDEQLLDDARQLTVHMWNDQGDDLYFTTFSNDGWEQDELQADVDDAAEGYGIS